METKRELKILAWIILVFAAVFFLPLGSERFMTAIDATLDLARWYAREHVILCLLPAFFIAGVIAVFVSQGSVIKYFGANAKKWLSYSVAAISGGILAVCSCTILPLFTSIYKRGAGLGPAIAFLYSGPAISILSIILTARILGIELGIARTLGAILFSVVIGLLMSFLFRREERAKREEQMNITPSPEKRPMWQTSFHFFTLVLILVFANWDAPAASDRGLWAAIFAWKWYITGALSLVLCWSLVKILRLRLRWVALGAAATVVSVVLANLFIRDAKLVPLVPMVVAIAALSLILLFDKRDAENREWALSAWGFAKQILPLLAVGVVTAGFLLGSTHDQTSVAGIIPNRWIEWAVGGNSLLSNFFASFTGAFMYFATLTEVPIIQGLARAGVDDVARDVGVARPAGTRGVLVGAQRRGDGKEQQEQCSRKVSFHVGLFRWVVNGGLHAPQGCGTAVRRGGAARKRGARRVRCVRKVHPDARDMRRACSAGYARGVEAPRAGCSPPAAGPEPVQRQGGARSGQLRIGAKERRAGRSGPKRKVRPSGRRTRAASVARAMTSSERWAMSWNCCAEWLCVGLPAGPE